MKKIKVIFLKYNFLLKNLFFLNIIFVCAVSCASFGKKLKNFLNGGDFSDAAPTKSNEMKYSTNPNVGSPIKRQYRRTTKQSLSEEAQLDGRAGSLWVMEGQGSYLFAQNIVRMIGDPLPVKLEGEPRDQLQTKVNVIRKLLAKIDQKNSGGNRAPAGSPPANGGEAAGGTAPGGRNQQGEAGSPDQQKTAEATKPDLASSGEGTSPQTIPTRITERLIDGNYRVRGSQPFMIGQREYKVLVTGVVRAEDFSDEGVNSSKLLDAKYDIVGVKRKEE